MKPISLLGVASVFLACACSSSSSTSAPEHADSGTESDSGSETDATDTIDSSPSSGDGGADGSRPGAVWTAGIVGKSCADACKEAGKTCAVSCTDHRSCGSHDGKVPPYAGYACYYYQAPGSSLRTNDGRSLMTCDEVASATWDKFGKAEKIGDYLGGNPVSCCCQ